MLDSIPLSLKIAMGCGVGLFIGFIGLKSGGIVVSNDATFLSLGNFDNTETLLAAIGFLLISVLAIRKITGAIIIGESRVEELIQKEHPETPCSNPLTAAKAAFKALRISKIATLTPYDSYLNSEMQKKLLDSGIMFTKMGSFFVKDDYDVAKISSESILSSILTLLEKCLRSSNRLYFPYLIVVALVIKVITGFVFPIRISSSNS